MAKVFKIHKHVLLIFVNVHPTSIHYRTPNSNV